MKVKIVMLGKDGRLTEEKDKAVKAMVAFYEKDKFMGELRLVPSKIKDFTDEGLIALFKRLSRIEKQYTTSQSEGSWEPRYTEDEDGDKKKRKVVFGPKK